LRVFSYLNQIHTSLFRALGSNPYDAHTRKDSDRKQTAYLENAQYFMT